MPVLLFLALILSHTANAAFDEPKCLSDNIELWVRIYTAIDQDTVLVVDPATTTVLETIYNAPEDKTARRKIIAAVKKRYENAGQKVRVLSGIKGRFDEGLKRFAVYKHVVLDELKKSDLPLEIAALPHVESSYNPTAISKVGAIGLWQVMPATARLIGFDHRKLRDPRYNTTVGVSILSNNYASLGSWPLAITAYNHGLNGVQRAVRSVGSTDICDITSKYSGPRFGLSSKNFYASFLAVLRVLRERGLLQ